MGKQTFYFDRCFGRRFPEALKRANPPFEVEYQNNSRFPHDMPDDEWLGIVGDRGWIVFSHDRKFHAETSEAMAVKQFSVGCFYLPGAQQGTWDKLCSFIRSYPKIAQIALEETKPFVFNVEATGRLHRIRLP